MPSPVVSICIVTYQHARFIARAIEGALIQQTDFPVEILIGEDESTDGTRETCQAYAQRFPERIKLFLRHRSEVVLIDGLPRGGFNLRMTMGSATGEFIALCEGDDHWTDPEKLQRQVDYLRANPDCVGCFHDTQLMDGSDTILNESYFQSGQEKFSQADVLSTLLSREPTCSLMFRRSAFTEPLPEWYQRRPSDLYLDLLLTQQGSLGFLRRNMGVYRKHASGIWSGNREASQIVELIIRYKLLLADPYFLGKYRQLLLSKIAEFQASLFTRNDLAGEVARLEQIVMTQTAAIGKIQAEGDRLAAEARQHTDALLAQLDRQARDSQAVIDDLLAQLKRLALISEQQAEYIASLEKERAASRKP